MARRAGSSVLGRIRKRFVALAVGLVALAMYVSSARTTNAAAGRGGVVVEGGAATSGDVQWTNFFGGDRQMAEEDPVEEEEQPAPPADAEEPAAPPPPPPAEPTPPSTPSNTPPAPAAASPDPTPSNTPGSTPSNSPAGTPDSTPSKTVQPGAAEAAAAAEGGATAAAAGGGKFPPQSQMQACGDFTSPDDVITWLPPQSEAERKASPRYDSELDYDFKDTAFVTMAAGDEAGRQVIGLVASLRASKTRVQDIIVMLSRGGVGSAECRGEDGGVWKREHKRTAVSCSGPDTIPEEIIGVHATDVLKQLGAVLQVVDPIPSTIYTEGIPGGRSFFWGMALNKLMVFNMTAYKKVIWMDSDTMVIKNIDHLFKEPMGTMAFTYACCNPNAPAIPSGGLWVLEPSLKLGAQIWRMMEIGKPAFDNKGNPELVPGPGGAMVPKREYWHWGDMQLVRWFFSYWPLKFEREPLWPQIDDHNHGAVEGLQYFPAYKGKSESEMKEERRATTGVLLEEGWHGRNWDGNTPVWRSLDSRYDQCVGHCECLPGRDMPDEHITLHFSCLQNGVNKPGGYKTEHDFGEMMYNNAMSCTRHYSWHMWYQQYFIPAYGRLPEPHWTGPPIPGYNETHDQHVAAFRIKAKGGR